MAFQRLKRFNPQGNSSQPLIIFNPHTMTPVLSSETIGSESYIRACIIDPGIKNCGLRIVRRDLKTNVVTTEYYIKLNFVYGENYDTNYYTNCIMLLSKFEAYFIWSQYICIESQVTQNYDLIRMGQHITTFLMMLVKDKGFR